jgi:hypothetical protein
VRCMIICWQLFRRMEISGACDPMFRSMSRELFSHPEDSLHRHITSNFKKFEDLALPAAGPPLRPQYQLSQSFTATMLLSELISIIRQYLSNYPAEFSFNNWVVSAVLVLSLALTLL